MKIQEILEKTTQFFKDKQIPNPRLDAEILISEILNLERIQLYLKFDQPISEEEKSRSREWVMRRSKGEPVAYIIGKKAFYENIFSVDRNVLIPRPETEQMVELVLEWTKGQNLQDSQLRILDIGCGSGCIGLSLLKKMPKSQLFSIDVSSGALSCAKNNAQKLNVLERVQFLQADAEVDFEKVKQAIGGTKINLIVANPPYIDLMDPQVDKHVREYEPEIALFSKDKGLHALKTWTQNYVSLLDAPGLCIMEMGFQQGLEMRKFYENLKVFDSVAVKKDLADLDRMILGVING